MRRLTSALFMVLVLACQARESTTTTTTTQAPASPSAAAPASTTSETAITSTESAVAPEVNPPGDIPDTQAFVKYKSSADGFELDVPEGWARTESGSTVTFIDKFDGVKVTVAPSSAAPTAKTVRTNEARQIQAQGRAVSLNGLSDVTLPGGKAVLVKYLSNSEPNSVTNKQVRLENEAYIFFRNGRTATLTLWAPKGADNVDQWQRMSKSFRWL